MSDEITITLILNVNEEELQPLAQQLANALARVRLETGRDVRLAELDSESLEESDGALVDFYRHFDEATPELEPGSRETTYQTSIRLKPVMARTDKMILVGSPGGSNAVLLSLLNGIDNDINVTYMSAMKDIPIFEVERNTTTPTLSVGRDVRRNWRQQSTAHSRLIHKRYRGVR